MWELSYLNNISVAGFCEPSKLAHQTESLFDVPSSYDLNSSELMMAMVMVTNIICLNYNLCKISV